MDREVKELVLQCLHCLLSEKDSLIWRRLTKSYISIFSMPAGIGGYRSVLLLEDGLRRFCEFISSVVANRDVTLVTILDCM